MRSSVRVGVAAAAAAAGLMTLVVPASAHVSVQPEGQAAKGGYATVNFKVPNERDNASTTKLEVAFPAEHPLASVMPQPLSGWDIEVTKSKLKKPLTLHGESVTEAVSKVTWTATGKGIAPGFFQKFSLSLGQLPQDVDELVFKALQTYSNQEVVRWIEPQQDGQEEPEHPAPVLALSASEGDEHEEQATEKTTAEPSSPSGSSEEAASSSPDKSDGTARALGIAGIVIGAVGVTFAVVASWRRSGA
ncbi:YcnI family protein [Streptomyces sp. NPDC057950]|uniref:YcnI family copper-binding membrane protein n=1 Tax=Streptomyces sp. NPDC057950 TaxID=3346288 RepID=UPI0036EC4711